MKPEQTPEQKANTNALLAWLDSGGDEHLKFSMLSFTNACGTQACMAGFLIMHDKHATDEKGFVAATYGQDPTVMAGNLIGMNAVDSYNMFLGWPAGHAHDTAVAAKRIRHWLETGEVIP